MPLSVTNREARSSTKDTDDHNASFILIIPNQGEVSRESSGMMSNESHIDKEQKPLEKENSNERPPFFPSSTKFFRQSLTQE